MENKKNLLVYGTIVLIGLLFFFGIFVLPYFPHIVSKNASDDQIANVIAYMNYFLTILATLGTISGLAFTIFGYYQTTKVPQMVKEEIEKRMEKIIPEQELARQQIEELSRKTNDAIKSLQLMIEPGFLGVRDVDNKEKMNSIDNAVKMYPDLWRANYYKAKICWNEFESHKKVKYREMALDLMNQHVTKHPEHDEAWIELINWLMKAEQQTRALTNLEKMLEHHPPLVELVNDLIDWSNLNTDEQKKYKDDILKQVELTFKEAGETGNKLMKLFEQFFNRNKKE
jgi:tetratricopeptide (TPR) repeat protein